MNYYNYFAICRTVRAPFSLTCQPTTPNNTTRTHTYIPINLQSVVVNCYGRRFVSIKKTQNSLTDLSPPKQKSVFYTEIYILTYTFT